MMVEKGKDRQGAWSTFLLLHGAGSDSWYWHLVTPRLVEAGHEVIAVDLPVDDDSCGLSDYAAAAIDAIESHPDARPDVRPDAWAGLTLVAQSMAAFSAPMVASKIEVELIVLVAPMVPAAGETAGDWWGNTGQPEAARQYAIQEGRDPDDVFDPIEVFLHDVDPAVVAASAEHVRNQSDRPFSDPWPLDGWPHVPTRCVIARRDRLFPLDFQRRVVRDRLGITADEIDSGHLPALSRPAELSQLLLRYRSELTS